MSVNTIVSGIIDYLKSKQQLDLLPEVAAALTRAGLTQTDLNRATVTTALPLSLDQKQVLKQTLSQLFKRPVRIKNNLDKRLIGGLRITWGGKIIDLSLDQQLKQLQETILYD